ncbi:MAG: hypothetical protein IPP76_01370 [Moraxellaceae bacterium]|nr:hypothetical protein [Moraxellaceae bacterium]
MSELLQKTTVLQRKLLRSIKVLGKLLVNDKVQAANNLLKPLIAKTCTTVLLVSLLATCQPSYAIAQDYQPLNNHSFNYVDVVAVNGNNGRQERRKLFKTVQHRTIADVFLCLPFIFLPFTGELRLALAYIALWQGGHRNKPFIRRILCAVVLRFSTLLAALILGKTSLPVEKV